MAKLTESELSKIREKLHVNACPNCGCADKRHILPMDGILPSANTSRGLNLGDFSGIELIGVACFNCGHVSFFSKMILLE